MESKYKFLLCRLCLGRNECLSDIFEDNGSRGYTAADIISELLQLQVSKTDTYPQLVCLECLDKLIDFKTFKACCLGAITIFEDKFSTQNADIINAENTPKTSVDENFVLSEDQGSHIISDESIDKGKDKNTFEPQSSIFYNTLMKVDTGDCESENNATQQKDDVTEDNNLTSYPVDIKEEELYLSNTDTEDSSAAIDQDKEEEVPAESLSITREISEQLFQQKQKFISRLMEHEAKRCKTKNLVPKKDMYICETCGHSFINHRSYLEHTYRHSGEKPYKCTFCGNHFRQLQTLRKHTQRIHFEKPYSCKFCTRKFMKEKTLLSHVKIHNREKTYPCKLCKKKFCYVKSLERHVLKHSAHKISFDCNECGKKFLTRYALKGHLTLHTGEKAYVCDECGKSIRLYSNFVVHKRVHSGEKPYSCNLCKKRFTQKGSLNSHLKLHKNV